MEIKLAQIKKKFEMEHATIIDSVNTTLNKNEELLDAVSKSTKTDCNILIKGLQLNVENKDEELLKNSAT